jgi:hypothetical protein
MVEIAKAKIVQVKASDLTSKNSFTSPETFDVKLPTYMSDCLYFRLCEEKRLSKLLGLVSTDGNDIKRQHCSFRKNKT